MILWFSIPKKHDLGLGWISEKPVKIVKKRIDYLVLGMFMDKVKKFCDHSMILWEMAGNLLTSGQNHTPPLGLLGLNLQLVCQKALIFNQIISLFWMQKFWIQSEMGTSC